MSILELVAALTLSTAAGVADCSCETSFEAIVEATESHYSGYRIKLPTEGDRRNYRRFRDLLRGEARSADGEACADLMSTYTGFFADHHLFAFPSDGRSPLLPTLKKRWTEKTAERHLARLGDDVGPLVGHWYDRAGRLFVVDDDALAPGTLAAVRLGDDDAGSIVGLIDIEGQSLTVLHRTERFGWQRTEAHLHRDGTLLAFGVDAWGREGAGHLGATDPQAPFLEPIDDGLVYLSMPSFMPRYRQPLNELVAEHAEHLESARGLVIDVRGNAGGDAIYFGLAPYFLANDIDVSEGSRALAAPWTVEYFERFRESLGDRGAWLDEPLKRMQENPGEIVDYLPPSRHGLESYPDESPSVVVLQDRGVGSAAEAFVYHARQSANVVTMGEPTRGNIDTMQVSMRTLGCGDFEFSFGYPLYFSARLPEGSVDDEGYAPDVHLPAGRDWLRFALDWLRADEHAGR